jgi:FAD dependent oxidoreductase
MSGKIPLTIRVLAAACIALFFPAGHVAGEEENPLYDIVVYGDSSGAVTAAIDAKRRGLSVILVNPTAFPGGMSASGLGATDFLGRRGTFGGIASEFYDGVAAAYGTDYVRSFEPHVGLKVFKEMLSKAGVTVAYNELLDREKGVKMDGKRIGAITTLSGKTYRGKMFIDATYVGDLMAAAGVTYTVGRDPESQYGEDMAGVRRGDTNPRVHYTQRDKDHFVKDVDPYIKPGDPESGLLPYVFKIEGLANGQGDRKIQAYNYRVCLTTDPALRIPIEKPAGYREIDHELLLRNFDAGDQRLPALIEPLSGTGSKVDWNNMHAVGSDHPGANWDYPEGSYERRREIEKEHETYIRGFLWTLSNNPRVPEEIRKKAAAYGLPKDEFTDNGGWPWMIYIREARRMVSDYVMTQHDCEGKRSAPDPVALGSFGMDSHCVQHFVTDKGTVQNEGVIWRVPPKPYGISYRSIIPRKSECENLFAPICLSTTHVAHGSIRMEPVFMALSQSAAIAASLAIEKSVAVQDLAYPELEARLKAAQQILWAKDATNKGNEKKKPEQPKR